LKQKNFFGYKAALGSFLVIFCCLGAASTLGVFLTPLAEYTGLSLATVGYIGTVNCICNILFSLIAMKVLAKIGPRRTMLIAILAISLHMVLYTLTTPENKVLSMILMYCAGGVASIAITFGTHAICSAVIATWFVEKRGQVTGMVLSGAGFGGAIWVLLAGILFKFADFKTCYWIMTALCLVIGLFAVFFLIKTPEQLHQKPLGWDTKQEGTQTAAAELPGVSKKEAMHMPAFYLLCAGILLSGVAFCAFMSYAPSWWAMNGLDSSAASLYDAGFLLVAALLLLIVGKIQGKLGAKGFVIYVCAGYILCLVCMLLQANAMSVGIMLAIVLTSGIAYPISASIPSLVTQSVFGPRDFAAISGSLMPVVYVSQLLCAPTMAIFLGTSGGMALGWKVYLACTAVGMVLLLASLFASPMKKTK